MGRTWMRHVLSRERRGQGDVLGDVLYQHDHSTSGRRRKHKPPKIPRAIRRGRKTTRYRWR